jgi:hypothetical protein
VWWTLSVDRRAEDLSAWGVGFGLRDEAGDAGVYDGVQALASLNAIDFVKGVLGKARDVEIFFGAGGGFWSREEGGAALDGPGEEDLSGSFADALGDCVDDGVFDEAGSHAVAERGEGEKNDAVVFAILQEFGFGEIGVRFDLNDGGLDAGVLVERLEFVERDVGEADGAAFAVVDESFESAPGVEESGFGIVDDVAVFVARVLVVAGLEGEGRVDEIEVEVGELKASEAGFEGGFDAVGTVIGVPKFCGDEDVLAGDGLRGGGEAVVEGYADFALVAIAFGAIEMTEAGGEGVAGGGDGDGGVGDEGAEAEGGDLARGVGEGDAG